KYSKNINAGTADVTVSSNASSNYSFDEVTVHFTISKAPINPVVAIADWTQGSEPSTPVISGNPGNGAVTYSYKVKGAADSTYSATVPSAVGRYTISANIAETANHLSGYATADFNIFKEAAVVTTAPAAYSLTYNGGAQALVSAGAVSGGTIKYAKGSSEAPAESFSEAIPAETNAGTYYVWYKAFGDDNHADSAMGSVMVVISKASQSAPAAPQKQSATTTSITLVSHYGYEYCRSGYAWQSSNTFNGLSADTEYTFYQRVSGDSNYEASPESAGAAFRTEALPTEEDPTPTKEAKPTPSENATPTPSENVTPTPSENVTPTPSENVTPTPTGEDIPTPTGEVTPTPSVTVTPTPTAGPLPTFAPTPTPTPVIVEEAVIKFVFADDTNSFNAEYTGNAIKPEIKGYCGSKLLEEGKDYSVSYSKNTAVGKANVNISGKGGYSGRYTLEFSITPKRIDDNGAPAEGIIVSGLTVKGTAAVKPMITYNSNVLSKKEYSVITGTLNGKETVTISANSINFTGVIKDLPVTRIKDKEAFKKTGIKAQLANVSHVYDGTPKLLGSELKVTDKEGTLLKEGTDYVVSYPSDVINAGSVKVQIIGIGNYTGSVNKSYKIEPAKNAAVSVKLIPEEGMPAGSYSYSKNGVTPAVFVTATVSGNTYVLADGIDYTVKYSNNKKAGTAAAIKLSFRGNYKGAETGDVNFTIEKAGFKDAEIFVGDMIYGKSGNYKAKPVIKVNGEVVANREYKLSYSISGNNMPKKLKLTNDETEKLITVTATSTGKGFKENDTISATYRVYRDNKTEVKKAKVTLVEKGGSKKRGNVAYTGNPITFSPDNIYRQADIQVKIGKTVLTGEDVFKNFEVSYADNVAKGKATIILTAKEDSVYSGMCVGTFKIVTRKVK
ncbi:MAG: hypothetical protein IJM34_02890, partial [Lachnospiraceae bacterium]|nr:hypothetical protein [Lachnospiraceae bacterium]